MRETKSLTTMGQQGQFMQQHQDAAKTMMHLMKMLTTAAAPIPT
jgi:hypothetical protein